MSRFKRRHPGKTGSDRWNERSPTRGFTIVELTFAILVMGIITAIVAPSIDFGRARVDGAVLEINALAMQAQRRAVLRQHDVRLLVDVTGDAILRHDDVDNDGVVDTSEERALTQLPEGTTFGLAGSPRIGGGTGTVVTFAKDPVLNQPVLTFHRNGSASEEGAIYVTALPEIDESHTRAIRFVRATGRTSCWSHRTGEWSEGC